MAIKKNVSLRRRPQGEVRLAYAARAEAACFS